MKETRERHNLWKHWKEFPQELKDQLPSIVGKWHYHYENKNGKIGLVRLNNGIRWDKKKNQWRGHVYEACGALDFQQFNKKKNAEIAIYKALKEKYTK